MSSPVPQYQTILVKLISDEMTGTTKRVMTGEMDLDNYRANVGFVLGLKRALEHMKTAEEMLYGTTPAKPEEDEELKY